MSQVRPPSTPLGSVGLRALIDADKAQLRVLRNDRELQHRLLAYPPDEYCDDLEEWLSRRQCQTGGAFFVVADLVTNACVGFVQISNIHNRGRHGDLGIAISESARGRGVGRVAINRLLEYATTELNLHKLQLDVLKSNARAVHLYESMSFKVVGTRVAHYYDGKDWQDVLSMEIILDENK